MLIFLIPYSTWQKELQVVVILFLCETLVFLLLPFLNLDAQIRHLQNRYTNLKSALDQLL